MIQSRHIVAGMLLIVCAVALLVPHGADAALPTGVEPAEITAHVWELPKQGGVFRADGSSVLDSKGVYRPAPGDRFDVQYREGLRLHFFNVGEQGGAQYADARIEYVREYLTPGLVQPKTRPEVTGKPKPDADDIAGKVPAEGRLKSYAQPLYFLRFTGGPAGSFSQTGGSTHPDGPITAQIVRDPLDGQHYIELRPFYSRASIDDPDAFLGWPGEEPLTGTEGVRSASDRSVAADPLSYRGQVTFLYPDGTKAAFGEDTLKRPLDRMPLGTVVSTGADSFLEVGFANGARLVLGPHTRVAFMQRGAAGSFLSKGKVLVRHPDETTDAASRTAMTFGVVAGPGAEWIAEQDDTSSSITLISGAANLSIPGTADSATLMQGEKATATADGLQPLKKADAQAAQAEWKALQRDAVRLRNQSLIGVSWLVSGAALVALASLVGLGIYGRRMERNPETREPDDGRTDQQN